MSNPSESNEIERQIEALQAPVAALRAAAARRLGQLKAGADALVEALHDPHEVVRVAAAQALSGIEPEDETQRLAILDHLLSAIDDPSDKVCQAAIWALGMRRETAAGDQIAELLDVANPYIAGNALLALARLGDQQISSRLLEMLQHPNEYIRVQAVRAVALLRYEPAGAIILQMLARLRTDRDAKGSTRHAMVNHLFEAVGALGLNDAVPTLVEIARQDVGLRGKAVETLIALQAEEAAAPLAHMLADPSSSLRRNLLVLMDTFQYRPAIPFIRPLLNDGLPSIRRAALQALTKMGDRESAAQIEWMAFHDSSPFVRVEAVEALAQLQGAEAMAAMHALANDPNADVRRAVVSSLIRFNTWNEAELRIAARFAADFPNDPLSEQIRPVLANQLPLPPDAGPMPVLETVPGLPPAMTDQRDQLAGLLEDWLAGLPAGSASEATRAALQHLLALLK